VVGALGYVLWMKGWELRGMLTFTKRCFASQICGLDLVWDYYWVVSVFFAGFV
jgi:hypothetical protein